MKPRHVLITGGAGAIGSALAREYLRTCREARVSLVDRDELRLAALQGELGQRASTHVWDLSEPSGLAALWDSLVATHGPIDVLVNCAGLMEVRNFSAMSWELGARILDVNLVSPLRLMELAVRGMSADGGAIINISSMAGVVPIRGCSYYGATKSGLAMASEIARVELARRGIAVVTVYPGPVYSALESRARAQVGQSRLARLIPTGRPEHVARLIVTAQLKGKPRVVFPAFYAIACCLRVFSAWFTRTFSPEPLE